MKPDVFFDAMGELSEEYIIVKLRIHRLRLNRRIVLPAVICFAVFYLLSDALFALLLYDFGAFSILEGQLRQLAILLVNALAGACSAVVLRRFVRREDCRSYVVFSVLFFAAVLAIGYVIFYYYYPAAWKAGNDQGLGWKIANLFPQMLETAFALPALIAQFVALFAAHQRSKKTADG